MLPFLLAAAAVVAILAGARSGWTTNASRASEGEIWRYVFAVHPDITSVAEFEKLNTAIKYALSQGGTLVDSDSQTNTLDVTVQYPGKPPVNAPAEGKIISVGPYSLTLTLKERIS